MIASNQKNPAAGVAAGFEETSLLGGFDAQTIPHKTLHVQHAIAALQRDFIVECLRIASLKSGHAADDIELGDDASAERGIRIAIQNLREAATGFRQLEELTAAIDALGERGAS
jgi:hypothetical protein